MTGPSEIPCGELMKADELTEAHPFACRHGVVVAQVISAIALGLAIFAAIGIVALRLIHCFEPDFLPWTLKSAIPLILIGIALASLQFVLRPARLQALLGLMAAAAFILWGTEQLLPNRAIASFVDDVVVLLFVLDVSVVIRGHLNKARRRYSQGSQP
jgi:hypothetical protein